MMRSKKILAALSMCFVLACCYGVHLLSSNTVFYGERSHNVYTHVLVQGECAHISSVYSIIIVSTVEERTDDRLVAVHTFVEF